MTGSEQEPVIAAFLFFGEVDMHPVPTIRRGNREIEKRSSLDVRLNEHVDGFSGYASTFWVADSYGTAMAPGSFKKSIRERGDKIVVLWNHNSDHAVGKHLSIKEDKKGLAVDIGIADDGDAGSVLLKRLRFGVPLGMSFGFQRIKSRSGTDDDPIDLSQLPSGVKKSEIEVYTENAYWESSAVTFPANLSATIDTIRSDQDIERLAALSQTLEDLRTGALNAEDGRWTLLQELVAALNERSEPEPGPLVTTPLPDVNARRNDILAQIALAEYAGYLSGD